MKKKTFYWQLAGTVFTWIFGTFFHFLFDLTNRNVIAALFSSVNESIWEHMKLIFYPMLLFAVVESYFLEKENQRFWCIKLKGISVGLLLIPVLYYTYTGILGTSADWFNIAIYFITVGVTFWLETRFFQKETRCKLKPESALIWLCLIAILFTVLTFFPLEIPFFQDPVTGRYGYY